MIDLKERIFENLAKFDEPISQFLAWKALHHFLSSKTCDISLQELEILFSHFGQLSLQKSIIQSLIAWRNVVKQPSVKQILSSAGELVTRLLDVFSCLIFHKNVNISCYSSLLLAEICVDVADERFRKSLLMIYLKAMESKKNEQLVKSATP